MTGESLFTHRTLVFVLAGGRGKRLDPLTRQRCKPALPFAGAYRIVDFTLSNCLNSSLPSVHVITQYRAESLEECLQPGWENVRVVPPRQEPGGYLGTADAIFRNLHFLADRQHTHVLVLASDHVYQMDYAALLRFHEEKGAALTIAGVEVLLAQAGRFGIMRLDASERIVDFQEKPSRPQALADRPGQALASMGIYVFDAEVLIHRLEEDAQQESSAHDFGRDIIPGMVADGAGVYAYRFRSGDRTEPGYWRDIGSIDSYWQASMEMVEGQTPFGREDAAWPLLTCGSFCQCYGGGPCRCKPAIASNVVFFHTVFSCGTFGRAARIARSVLSCGVELGEGAELQEVVLMEGVRIGRGARLRRVVVDRGVTIPPNVELDGEGVLRLQDCVISRNSGIAVISSGASDPQLRNASRRQNRGCRCA